MKLLLWSFLMLMPFARESAAGQPLSLQDCLRLAKEHDLRMQAVLNRVHHAALAHEASTTGSLPQITLGLAGSIAPRRDRYGYDPAVTDGGQLSAQVILRQSIFDAGVRSVKREQLRIDQERAGIDVRLAERDRTLDVTQAFIVARRTQRRATTLEESRDRLAEYLSLVRSASQAGAASQTDVLKTEIQLSMIASDVRSAKSDDAIARLTLAETIGITIDTTITVGDGGEEGPSPGLAMPISPDSLYPLELSRLELDRRRADLDVEIARDERLPVIGLVADAGYLGSVDNLRAPTNERYVTLGVSVGVQVELPLFDGGATRLRIQEEQLNAGIQQIAVEEARRSLTAEYGRVVIALAAAEQRLVDAQSRERATADHYGLTVTRFAAGGTSSLEVLDALKLLTEIMLETTDVRAEIDLGRAKLNHVLAR